MMDYKIIAEKVKDHVLLFFTSRDTSKFLYHNRLHTEQVVNAATQIANHYPLNERDYFIVTTAAWFHDTGYFEQVSGHEVISAKKAELFLRDQQVDDATINAVKGCILATQLPQNPANLLEQIVCDADLFDLGKAGFVDRNKLLRAETELLNNTVISKKKWYKKALRFLEDHHYFTDYCQRALNKEKQEHIAYLKNKIKSKKGEKQVSPAPVQATPIEENTINEAAATESKKQKTKPYKGIETMFRISSGNNQRLSNMADTKAHIMISVNSIVISILLSFLVRKMDEYQSLTIPTTLMLLVNLVTIIFSMLATRPRLPKGSFDQADLDEKKVNLLFFGNYYRMNFEEYYAGMMKVMDDRTFLYLTLTRDVYQQGIVLSRKYHMLQIAYAVFMYGLIASVIAFIIAAWIH